MKSSRGGRLGDVICWLGSIYSQHNLMGVFLLRTWTEFKNRAKHIAWHRLSVNHSHCTSCASLLPFPIFSPSWGWGLMAQWAFFVPTWLARRNKSRCIWTPRFSTIRNLLFRDCNYSLQLWGQLSVQVTHNRQPASTLAIHKCKHLLTYVLFLLRNDGDKR
jgi:hypothetical protein